MPIRKVSLANDAIYHVYNKSIAGFKIFNDDIDCDRMMELICFYIVKEVPCKFSIYKTLKNIDLNLSERNVDIVAYCIMPTHIHFVLKQKQDCGIEKFIGRISQSYSQYFNTRHARNGPLWEGRFKNVMINSDEQLLHLTRYIHLNPVSAFLVNNPGDWKYSSYREFLKMAPSNKKLCNFHDLIKVDPVSYKKFVLDQIDYQRQLEIIKKVTLD